MSTVNVDNLRDVIGAVGESEFHQALESTKPGLLELFGTLRDMPDDEFLRECEYRIWDSVNCNRFRGNYWAEHCRATACAHESRRRHRAAGHDEDCHGPTIYSRAHARLMRDHGYTPTPDGECHCKSVTR